MYKKIWLSSPHMGNSELAYVQEAFATNWIAPLGPHVNGFEADLKKKLGGNHEVAVLSSGTAAIHLGLIMLGVGPGDLVFCQSFTFSASANPIVYQGATPVFIDSEEDTWNMCPQALRKGLEHYAREGKKPKAILPVHLYGMPAKMDELIQIAGEYGIPVLEDAAEALGSSYKGKPCGTFGRIGILSFNGNKIITTSGGGALASTDASIVEKARFLSTQARDAAPHYQHSEIGYNYRMSNICAGIGRGQMEVLDERVAQRRAHFNGYKMALSLLPGITLPEEPEGFFSNRWLTTILVDPDLSGGISRDTIRLKMETLNIECRPLWKPMHLQPVFEQYPYFGNEIAARLFDQGLCLPSGSNMPVEDRELVIHTIKSLF